MTSVFTNAGTNRVRDLLKDDIHHGQLGTGSTAPTYADTALVSANADTSILTSETTTDKQIVVDYNLPSTSATGVSFTEFGLFNASDTMFARFVFASLIHSSTEQWQLSTRIYFD